MCRLPFTLAIVVFDLWSAAAQAQPNTLTQDEIAQGWMLLFDGKTTAGWDIQGDAEVVDGILVFGGKNATRAGPRPLLGRTFELRLEYRTDPGTWVAPKPGWVPPINIGWETKHWLGESMSSRGLDRHSKDQKEWIEIVYTGDFDRQTGRRFNSRFRAVGEAAFISQSVGGTTAGGGTRVSFEMPAGPKLHLRNVKLKTEPVATNPLYFGAAVVGILVLGLIVFAFVWLRRRNQLGRKHSVVPPA